MNWTSSFLRRKLLLPSLSSTGRSSLAELPKALNFLKRSTKSTGSGYLVVVTSNRESNSGPEGSDAQCSVLGSAALFRAATIIKGEGDSAMLRLVTVLGREGVQSLKYLAYPLGLVPE